MQHQITDLIKLFEQTFYRDFNTKLVRGGNEPIYLPADNHTDFHQVVFAHGYFASGLHEIAHWCIAGKERRLLEDFGYWYLPDGRDRQQQQAFEQVEVKPQAIEWAFCVAANKKFTVSADNLNGDAAPNIAAFSQRVFAQVQYYLTNGFPPRAQQFIDALAQFYQVPTPLTLEQFLQKPQVINFDLNLEHFQEPSYGQQAV